MTASTARGHPPCTPAAARYGDAAAGRSRQRNTNSVFTVMTNSSDQPYSGPIYDEGVASPPPPKFQGVVMSRTREAARAGVTMGSALAIAISWSIHKSILWAIIHGFFSWLYVSYYALTRR